MSTRVVFLEPGAPLGTRELESDRQDASTKLPALASPVLPRHPRQAQRQPRHGQGGDRPAGGEEVPPTIRRPPWSQG